MSDNIDQFINDPDISKFEIGYLLEVYRNKLQDWLDYGFPPESIEDLKMKINKLQQKFDHFVQHEIN